MNFKIYAMGSNDILAEELRQALSLILKDYVPIFPCISRELKNHTDGTLYICNQSQRGYILEYIDQERIVMLNMEPTTRFYVKLTSIPIGSDIYVFNNRQPYIDSLISLCHEMGLKQFHYIPVPYQTLSADVIKNYLSNAEYIIGVDRILDEVLWSEKYRGMLREDVMTIGAKRVVSVESTCNVIKKVNEYMFDYINVSLNQMLTSFHNAKHNETLYTHYRDLEGEFQKIKLLLSDSSTPSESMKDIIFRSALNQLLSKQSP